MIQDSAHGALQGDTGWSDPFQDAHHAGQFCMAPTWACQGEVAPVTREMIRQAEPDRRRRPHVHVG